MAYHIDDTKDGVSWTGGRSANTIGPFVLLGGKYMYYASAASTSSTLNILLPDEATYVAVGSSTTGTTSAVGPVVVDLVPGTYEVVLVATSDVQGFLQKIPYTHYGSF